MKRPGSPFSRRRGERGQSLVEFALALPLFFATIFGIIQFGVAVFRYNIISDLAQEGARWAAVRGTASGALAASQADVQTFVRSRSLNINVTVTSSADPSSLSAGQTIQVTVSHTFPLFTRIVRSGNITLQSTAQMIMAR